MNLRETIPDLELLSKTRVPILMYEHMKKKKDPVTKKNVKYKAKTMCSINNWATIHWHAKSEIKNKYKNLLKEWYISDKKLPEDIFFVWQPIYTDKRRRDSLNQASICKIIEDSFVESEVLIDDNKTGHILLPGYVDKDCIEHTLEFMIFGKIESGN